MSSSVARVELDLSHLSATVCAELAAGLTDATGIKAKYGITDAQWAKLKNSKVFRNMLRDAIREWTGDINAGKRITKKAEIMLEDSLPILYEIAHDMEVQPANRIESLKQMSVLAGRTQKQEGQGASGGGFNVNIIMRGREEKHVVIEGEATSIPPLVEAA